MADAFTRIEPGDGRTGAHKDPRHVDPHEDWEQVTRPAWMERQRRVLEEATGLPHERLQPVYVQLLPEGGPYAPSAAIVLAEAAADAGLFVDDLARTALERIAGLEADAAAIAAEPASDARDRRHALRLREAASCARLPLFRFESTAYDPHPAFEVVEVGPALPLPAARPPIPRAVAPAAQGAATLPGEPPVLTAVIDDVVGFANERFRSGPRATRIARFWAQSALQTVHAAGAIELGKPLSDTDINLALAASNGDEVSAYHHLFPQGLPWQPSGRLPGTGDPALHDPAHRRPLGLRATHGTQVLDLAAGWPLGEAPQDRPIVAVQLPLLATAETWGARLDLFVLMGLLRIFNWADTLYASPAPVVVNFSYAVTAGPMDGTGFLESEIARLVKLRNDLGRPTRVVLPAGNSYRARGRAAATLAPGEATRIELRVQPEDLSVSFVELWLSGETDTELTLTPPSGPGATFPLGHGTQGDWFAWEPGGAIAGRIYMRRFGARLRVVVALSPTLNHDTPGVIAPSGRYALDVRNTGSAAGDVSIEVQRDDVPKGYATGARQAYFDGPGTDDFDPETHRPELPVPGATALTRDGTLSAFATSREEGVWLVGATMDRDAILEALGLTPHPAPYTSSGPTLARSGPDLAAVADETRTHPGRTAAGTFSGSAFPLSGTSAAAPLVTRALVGVLDSRRHLPPSIAEEIAAMPADPLPPAPVQDKRLGAAVLRMEAAPGRLPRRARP